MSKFGSRGQCEETLSISKSEINDELMQLLKLTAFVRSALLLAVLVETF